MQQYFVDRNVKEGDIITLSDDILYHLIKVLRKDNTYTFRIADASGNIYHANLISNKECKIGQFLNENNELKCNITCILSLIKNDKFELTLQKLVELGVTRIVPYKAVRSVVKVKDDRKLDRLNKIVREAAEQSHRNIIPQVCPFADIKSIEKYKSDYNYICYESETNIANIKPKGSITYVIGPEGGFEDNEYKKFVEMGFESVSLGKRILRAETAAIFMTSIIVEKNQ